MDLEKLDNLDLATLEQLKEYLPVRTGLIDKLDARLRMALHSSHTTSPARVAIEEARRIVQGFRESDERMLASSILTTRAMERLGVLESVSAMRKQIAHEPPPPQAAASPRKK